MFKISGIGCILLDHLYGDIDFQSSRIKPFLSKTEGDGGLTSGKLVLTDDFEKYCKMDIHKVLRIITEKNSSDYTNIGGPSVVSLIHARQLLDNHDFEIQFYGTRGNDLDAQELEYRLKETPLINYNLIKKNGYTPCTYVLCDPQSNKGHGERTFLNQIGSAKELTSKDIKDEFWDAQLIAFGGTALTPLIHKELGQLLKKAKANGSFTLVNTVYDYPNQRLHPDRRWPLGTTDETYSYIDLLVMDKEEAIHLSGETDLKKALVYFETKHVGAVVITNGTNKTQVKTFSEIFTKCPVSEFPICENIAQELLMHPEIKKDTTGCGDNFAGGLITEIAKQLNCGNKKIDLLEALIWASVSGGITCYYKGGVFQEKQTGEKLTIIKTYMEEYRSNLRKQKLL